MKSAISKRKIGTPYFYDQQSGVEIKLPEGYLIYNYNRKTWLGGSTNGQQVMNIERIPTTNGQIPTILAEGDLDLFICSTGTKIEQISEQVTGIEMEGEFSGQDIKGYLAMVDLLDGNSYLILVASIEDQSIRNERNLALNIAASLLSKVALAA